MQRQHLLVYLAALDDPLATGLDSQINFRPYPGLPMAPYDDWGLTGVSTGTGLRSRFAFCAFAISCSLFKESHKARAVRSV